MILRSLLSAFLMYSRIPMPKVEWKEENRKFSLCFFPLIGAVIGCILLLFQQLCSLTNIGIFIKSSVSVLIPVLITGGIHIDGFCDTTDALSSCAERQKKLEIMSDPHIGSFAVIGLCSMFLLQFSLFCEIQSYYIIAVGYVLSRSLSGIAAVTLRSAKSNGSLQNFVKPAHKKITIIILVIIAVLCTASMCIIDLITGSIVCFFSILFFIIYRAVSYRNFGGITGDTEGWYLQINETLILAAVYLSEKAVMLL